MAWALNDPKESKKLMAAERPLNYLCDGLLGPERWLYKKWPQDFPVPPGFRFGAGEPVAPSPDGPQDDHAIAVPPARFEPAVKTEPLEVEKVIGGRPAASPARAMPPQSKLNHPHNDYALRLEFAQAECKGLELPEEVVNNLAARRFDEDDAENFERWLKYRNSPPGPGDLLADRGMRLAFVCHKRKGQPELAINHDTDAFHRWDDRCVAEFYAWVKAGERQSAASAS